MAGEYTDLRESRPTSRDFAVARHVASRCAFLALAFGAAGYIFGLDDASRHSLGFGVAIALSVVGSQAFAWWPRFPKSVENRR